jgi:hypothetical protein
MWKFAMAQSVDANLWKMYLYTWSIKYIFYTTNHNVETYRNKKKEEPTIVVIEATT